jgi:hypothetical protein
MLLILFSWQRAASLIDPYSPPGATLLRVASPGREARNGKPVIAGRRSPLEGFPAANPLGLLAQRQDGEARRCAPRDDRSRAEAW